MTAAEYARSRKSALGQIKDLQAQCAPLEFKVDEAVMAKINDCGELVTFTAVFTPQHVRRFIVWLKELFPAAKREAGNVQR